MVAAMCAIGIPAVGPLIIAHRGASHDAPENTLAAFRLAWEQGADGIEADFYLSADGHVLCLHDQDAERVAGQKLDVTRAPFDQLRALDVGGWKGPRWRGEKMPTMAEVLAVVPTGKKIFIELKSGPEIVEPMAKLIALSSLAPDQIVIISFDGDTITNCKQQLPNIRAHWLCRYTEQEDGSLTPTVDEVAATLQRIHADGLGTEARPEFVNEAFIKRLRDSGCREFHVWTVDDAKIARFYQALGAWAITTNQPAWLRERITSL